MSSSSALPNGSSDDAVEKTVSLEDIHQENRELKELEADARAVLGNSDAEHCTWDQGYVKRQALYACVTCRPDSKDPSTRAGVCLACSYSCHDGHDLVELYTKRAFRCDCGNHKFIKEGQQESSCKLMPGKNRTNSDNVYNQNYDGDYCTCGRPYPDPEDNVEDDMIQCVVCEDWFHSRHLRISKSYNGGNVPEDYHEMICHLCSAENPFLHSYANGGDLASVATVVTSSTVDKNVDVESVESTASTAKDNSSDDSSRKRKQSAEEQTGKDACRLNHVKKTKPNEADDHESSSSSSFASALFFSEGWRSTLCSCADCKRMYEEKKIAFLTLEDDSVGAYEAAGAPASEEEEEEAALGSLLGGMDRFQQGELLTGYNDMKTALNDFLRQFAEEGKVVTAEDIRTFFQEMEAKKRARGAPQYFCG